MPPMASPTWSSPASRGLRGHTSNTRRTSRARTTAPAPAPRKRRPSPPQFNSYGPSTVFFERPWAIAVESGADEIALPSGAVRLHNRPVSSHPEFDWRPLDRGQVRAMAGLIAAIEAVDHQDEHLGEEDLAEDFDDPEADYERGSVAMYRGHTMIGFSVLSPRTAAEPGHEMRLDGGVH